MGLAPGDPYTSPLYAAAAALRQFGPIAQANGVEAGGYLVQRPDNTFSYTPVLFSRPEENAKWSVDAALVCRQTDRIVGKYHSHPLNADPGFSALDEQSAIMIVTNSLGYPWPSSGYPYMSALLDPSGHLLTFQPRIGAPNLTVDTGSLLGP
jgi:hypothetical protein